MNEPDSYSQLMSVCSVHACLYHKLKKNLSLKETLSSYDSNATIYYCKLSQKIILSI